MPPKIVIPFLADRQEKEETERQDRGVISRRREARNGLRDSNADEVEVRKSCSLKEELFG